LLHPVFRALRFVGHSVVLCTIAFFSCDAIPRLALSDTVLENDCASRDLLYKHSSTTCKLLREATNDVMTRRGFCLSMPGLTSKRCDTFVSGIQDGVKSVEIAAGTATVTDCTNGSCDSTSSTTCDISYLKVTGLKQPSEMPTEQNGIVDSLQNVIIGYNCSWNGSTITYTVINNTSLSQTVSWIGTPFTNRLIGAHSQTVLSVSNSSPSAFEEVVTALDGLGHVQVLTATTIVPSAPGAPGLSRWGALVLAVILGGTGMLYAQGSRDRTKGLRRIGRRWAG